MSSDKEKNNIFICVSRLCKAEKKIITNVEDLMNHMGEEHENSNLNFLQTKLSQKENPISLITNKWSQNQLLQDLEQKVKDIQNTFTKKLNEISTILKEQIIAHSKQMEELKNVTEIILQGDYEKLLTVQDKFNIIHKPQQDFLNDVQKYFQASEFLVKDQEEIFKSLNDFISNEFIDKLKNRDKLITYKSIAPQDSKTQTEYQLNFDQHTTDTFKIRDEEQLWIRNFLFQSQFTLKLLYRGSRDGFTPQAFHEKCDNQGPTFTLIKSEQNKVFGGYTSQSWNQSIGGYLSDDQAYLFSLTNFTKHQVTQKQYAINNSSSYLCVFGGGNGCDIAIQSSCNSSNTSFTSFPTGYKHNESLNENTKKYLAGAYSFKVIEIETYSVMT